jgi:hypothetical protein
MVLALSVAPSAETPLSIRNSGELGTRALAQVLRSHGVEVSEVDRTSAAIAHAREGTTLAILTSTWLTDEQAELLADVDADVVVIGQTGDLLDRLSHGALTDWYGDRPDGTLEADCDDPDAQAAGRVSWNAGVSASAQPGIDVCFVDSWANSYYFDEPDSAWRQIGGYASMEADGRRITVLPDVAMLLNSTIAEDGNAALALRTLGRHKVLTWYVAQLETGDLIGSPSLFSFLPRWVPIVGGMALVAAAGAALWRGRRLGAPVPEPLPVEVPASQLTRGHGRLYRRTRATGHAAAALRAGTLTRLAAATGLLGTSPPDAIVHTVAHHTRREPAEVRELLYGPAPTSEGELTRLAQQLEQLEQEASP